MTCFKAQDCAGCADCDDQVQPVLPRCQDVVINDGKYVNATITVEGGCITLIEAGVPMLYQPDACCAPVAGGGGGDGGLDGNPGADGEAATIQVGTVSSTAPGTAPTVNNVGTATHAILNFTFPRGEPGEAGQVPSGGVNSTAAGFEIEQGLVKQLPANWPPILTILSPATVDDPNASLIFAEDANGIVTVTLSLNSFAAALKAYSDAAVDVVQTQVTTLQADLAAVQAQLATCCPP